jgi:hypothetical protein
MRAHLLGEVEEVVRIARHDRDENLLYQHQRVHDPRVQAGDRLSALGILRAGIEAGGLVECLTAYRYNPHEVCNLLCEAGAGRERGQ